MARKQSNGNLLFVIFFLILTEYVMCSDMRGNGYSEDSPINDTPSLNRLLRDALVERTEAEIESLKRRLQEELETTEGQLSQRTKQETKRGQSDGIVSLYVLSKELAEVQRQREISDMKKQMDIQGRRK